MTGENKYQNKFGEKSAFTSTFQTAIRLMTSEQLTALLDDVTISLTSAESVWDDDPTGFGTGFIEGFKRIQFRVGQQLDIAEGEHIPSQEFAMVCIECHLPFSPLQNQHCIGCGSDKWIEVDRTSAPSRDLD